MVFLPNTFKIKVDRVTQSGITESRQLAANLIHEEDLRFKDPIEVTVLARKVGEDITVQGTIKATAVMTCARCLEEFELHVEKKKYFAYFKKPPVENINLTESIREDIIVSLPIRVLCRESCKGLCAQCGQNLNEKQCDCTQPQLPKETSVFDSLKDVFGETKE